MLDAGRKLQATLGWEKERAGGRRWRLVKVDENRKI